MKAQPPKGMPDMGSNTDVVSEPPIQGAPANLEDHLASLAKQMAALTALVGTVVQSQAAASGIKFVSPIEDQPLPDVQVPAEPRVWIVLEDNDEIPPTGQFIGVQGVPYLLRPSEPAHVPVSLVDVLDHAIKSVPVTDSNQTVIGYRDRLRFPYRVLRERDIPKAPEAEETYPAAHVSME